MNNSSSTFFTRFLFLQMAIAALLSIPFTVKAQHVSIGIGLPQAQGQMLRASLHRSIRGRITIPVKQLIREQTGVQLQGPEIERIILIASSNLRGHAQAQLIIDDQRVLSPQLITGTSDKVVFPLNRLNRRITNMRNLKLEIIGDVYLEEVMVKTSNSGHQQGPSQITIPLNTTLRGRSSTRLSDLLLSSRSSLPQAPIRSISLLVSSRSRGAIGIIARGLGMLQNTSVDYTLRTISVDLPMGTDLQDITLNATGEIELRSLTLELEQEFETDWFSL